nr:hypothetical protein [Bradyrhizobium diazoefficiens]
MDGQPDGRATLDIVKRHLAVFYSSGSEWSQRMKRLAERAPSSIDIFGQKLVTREPGEWCITEAGRAFLAGLERLATAVPEITFDEPSERQWMSERLPLPSAPHRRLDDVKARHGRKRRTARERRSA